MATDVKKWAAENRSSAIKRIPRYLEEAKGTFVNELTPKEQVALVRELVETREAELMRAYSDLVGVYFGYPRHRTKKGLRRTFGTACVTFVVTKKWRSKTKSGCERELPSHLLAYWTVAGRRKLCAAPTDVDESADYANVEPATTTKGVLVEAKGSDDTANGLITCAVQRSIFPTRTYALSCRHVFALSTALHPKKALGSAVRLKTGEEPLARTRNIIGNFGDGIDSLDAQLAEMTSVEGLRKSLAGLEFKGIAENETDVQALQDFFLITPSDVIPLQLATFGTPSIDYGRAHIRNVRHRQLIISDVLSGIPVKGNSGAPIMSRENGGILVGMHIARNIPNNGNRQSYAIPAWHLFDPQLYGGTSSTEKWSLIDPDAIDVDEDATVSTTQPLASMGPPEYLPPLLADHGFRNSVKWRLTANGLRVEDRPPEVTHGPPQTVGRILSEFQQSIERWAQHYNVPIELIVSTIATESSGDPTAIREESGYVSDRVTPTRISAGLMQTLISTAREALGDDNIDRAFLLTPDGSIRAGTSYIAGQSAMTSFDPPKVVCAYNAGSVRRNNSSDNRWKMRQFPIGTGEHCDRFIKWFNDVFRLFDQTGRVPTPSFYRMLR